MSTESDFLAWVRTQQSACDFVRVPAGDDLAVLNWPAKDLMLVGIDQVLDGVHFDSAVHCPRAIGRKAMNRNLSDCAAMACLPAAAVVSVALHSGTGMDYAKELYEGLREAADLFDCKIVGGDTGSWPGKLVVTVAIMGRSDGGPIIERSGAKPENAIYVSGPLGGSLLGRHMTFEPRVQLARTLAKTGAITAMMDLSDGLSRDLPRLCERSGVAAIVDAALVPIHDDAVKMSRDGRAPLEHALHDGEDYELLFTADASANLSHFGVTRIGRIVTSSGVSIEHDGALTPLVPLAWEHTL